MTMWRWWLLIVGIFLLSMGVSIYVANAHDGYSGLKNGQNVDCCNGRDCKPFDGEAKQVRGGWLVNGEFVADDRVLPSFDVNFHQCYWNKQTRCFLVPGSS